MAKHHFHLQAEWTGGLYGQGTISAGNLHTQISVPQSMGGPGIGSNPDEMFIGAAATCYLITLATMLDLRKIPLRNLSLHTVGVVNEEKGRLTFEQIIHQPHIDLAGATSVAEVEKIRRVADLAEKSCMISRAMKGNVAITVQAKITVNGEELSRD